MRALFVALLLVGCSTRETPETKAAKVTPAATCTPKPKSEVECKGTAKWVATPAPFSRPTK